MKRSNEFLFAEALAQTREFGGRNIVEIGSIRDASGRKTDGHSTVAWGASGLPTWSVDLDFRATKLTNKVLGSRFPQVKCLTCDGIWFLDTFPQRIDLLYLDGPHPDKENGRQWAADAFNSALPRFSSRAVVLIDDTDLPRRGKGELAIPLAEYAGFVVMRLGRQALLVRDAS